ncbi:hypothetical protein ACSNOJ_03745 [Streptomyces sp. URMC 128]|uniref:hypothetical protein n=1 Tax=Streptomyces sp. URMC 128 TaxID=3423404 RepID=UPI003F1CD8C8
MSAGGWRYAPVRARQNWPDGTICYQVEVDLLGDRRVRILTYEWPQPGLRVARRIASEPTRGVDETRQGDMPHRGPTHG